LIIELHPAAEAEARAAWVRYRAYDPAVAARFAAALDRAIGRISDSPNRWPNYLHGTRRLLLRRFPFAVVYRVGAERVLIIAIAHQRRRPGYWGRRG
jgi:plasmid stabilization system protein ParE